MNSVLRPGDLGPHTPRSISSIVLRLYIRFTALTQIHMAKLEQEPDTIGVPSQCGAIVAEQPCDVHFADVTRSSQVRPMFRRSDARRGGGDPRGLTHIASVGCHRIGYRFPRMSVQCRGTRACLLHTHRLSNSRLSVPGAPMHPPANTTSIRSIRKWNSRGRMDPLQSCRRKTPMHHCSVMLLLRASCPSSRTARSGTE